MAVAARHEQTKVLFARKPARKPPGSKRIRKNTATFDGARHLPPPGQS